MGLLDDAIREHLELKRKHGANPEDVARQEQEALGPGMRNEFAQTGRARDPDAGGGRSAGARAARSQDEPPAEPVAPPGRLRGGPVARRRPRRGPRRRGAPAAAAAARSSEEDVLEETPDFLQETPEHDRLWFEQKPPKDFDWDK